MRPADPLPIDAIADDLARCLASQTRAVLVAPPGAGKTTRVPLILLDEPWAQGKRLILLEPRRLAARAAAERMAHSLEDVLGGVVGLRVRMQSRTSARTRIEVVTEGVFARMILDDPSLEGVAGVLFDEFHERSLDADMGLALALDAQAGLREDLRILVMSATLDGARVAALMGDCPVIESQGRAFAVETRHAPRDTRARIEDEVAKTVTRWSSCPVRAKSCAPPISCASASRTPPSTSPPSSAPWTGRRRTGPCSPQSPGGARWCWRPPSPRPR